MLMERNDRLDAHSKVLQSEVLIRRVNRVAVQPEAHKHRIKIQFFFEQGHDRNASAIAGRDRPFSPYSFERLRRRGEGLAIAGCYSGLSAMVGNDIDAYRFGRNGLYVPGEQLRDLVARLVGHKTHGYLGVRLRRQNGLGAFRSEEHTSELQSRENL